jgi:hypothetical protein
MSILQEVSRRAWVTGEEVREAHLQGWLSGAMGEDAPAFTSSILGDARLKGWVAGVECRNRELRLAERFANSTIVVCL